MHRPFVHMHRPFVHAYFGHEPPVCPHAPPVCPRILWPRTDRLSTHTWVNNRPFVHARSVRLSTHTLAKDQPFVHAYFGQEPPVCPRIARLSTQTLAKNRPFVHIMKCPFVHIPSRTVRLTCTGRLSLCIPPLVSAARRKRAEGKPSGAGGRRRGAEKR